MKRTQHPGDVAQRQRLLAPLLQRSGWLPFEIDNHEVIAGVKNLPQMIVAVMPDTVSANGLLPDLLVARLYGIFESEQCIHLRFNEPIERRPASGAILRR